MPLKTAERNTLQALTAELVQNEVNLTNAQSLVQAAISLRDESQQKLTQFIDSIPVSDAPAEVKRGRPRGSKTRHIRGVTIGGNPVPVISEFLASSPNAALSGTGDSR